MDNFDLRKYLAEGRLLKEELTWYVEDENADIRFQNDEYLKEVGKKIKEIHPDISSEDLNKIIIMTGEQYSREEDFHGDSIPSGNFVDAAVEIYQTDVLGSDGEDDEDFDRWDPSNLDGDFPKDSIFAGWTQAQYDAYQEEPHKYRKYLGGGSFNLAEGRLLKEDVMVNPIIMFGGKKYIEDVISSPDDFGFDENDAEWVKNNILSSPKMVSIQDYMDLDDKWVKQAQIETGGGGDLDHIVDALKVHIKHGLITPEQAKEAMKVVGLTEGRLFEEKMSLEVDDDFIELSADSGEYNGDLNDDGTVDFSVVYDDGTEFDDSTWKSILGKKHAFVKISNQIPTKVEAAGDYVMITVDLEDLKNLIKPNKSKNMKNLGSYETKDSKGNIVKRYI
jgi:hypothetical protein